MSYATYADLLPRYKPIYTMVGTETLQVTSLEVNSVFIYGAEGIMDAYLGRRYQTPVPASPLITHIACDLALFNMLVEKLPQVPDYVKDRYDRSMKMLEQIAEGEMVISSASILTTGDQEVWSSGQGYHGIFSPVINMEDQRVDEDRADYEKGQRTDDATTP